MPQIKQNLNVPNLLSLYRLLSFPVVLYMIFNQQEKIFIILLAINLVSDILDGFIARTFKLETPLGARLDTLGDISMYISALTGVIVFKAADFELYMISFSIFLGMFTVPIIISMIKFRKISSLHLYSSKASTLLQGIFFFYLFIISFDPVFYYIVIAWGMLSYIEQSTILLLSRVSKANARGLYWVLKSRKRANDNR